MRSNAPASPCWARRMASASDISLDSVLLVRFTVPVGTHPVGGMHPRLLELHLYKLLVLVWYRHWPSRAAPTSQACGKEYERSRPYFLWKCYVRLELTVRMAGTCMTSFSLNTSSSSAGQAQEYDFNMNVGSAMHV